MALSIGIIGLPNVGKSTLFNALTKAQNAAAENYPFCTIEPNKAVVPLPDERLKKIVSLVKPIKSANAVIAFLDIAGLVKGASKGEGLGNQFLGNIRECSVLIHIVRCFENEDIIHVEGNLSPSRDIETLETELLLSDIQTLERKIEKLQKTAKAGDKNSRESLGEAQSLLAFINENKPAIFFPEKEKDTIKSLLNELKLMTSKKVIFCANVDEDGLITDNEYVNEVKNYAVSRNAAMVKISARMEEELISLNEAEQEEYLASSGSNESGLKKVIKSSFEALNLISFFTTTGGKEVREWIIPKGTKAPQAAGEVHTDFEKGFIRAEVIKYEDFIKFGSEAACRSAGLIHVHGKDYTVEDGDIIHFLFNV
ncbi:MAG TPA: redox-regulated ATPase YchF [Ignavibacteriaceae bacterium]|nr:redox-regulated ATPase YchF [Ignavibacteriaceae bacterium]